MIDVPGLVVVQGSLNRKIQTTITMDEPSKDAVEEKNRQRRNPRSANQRHINSDGASRNYGKYGKMLQKIIKFIKKVEIPQAVVIRPKSKELVVSICALSPSTLLILIPPFQEKKNYIQALYCFIIF